MQQVRKNGKIPKCTQSNMRNPGCCLCFDTFKVKPHSNLSLLNLQKNSVVQKVISANELDVGFLKIIQLETKLLNT